MRFIMFGIHSIQQYEFSNISCIYVPPTVTKCIAYHGFW